MALQEHLIRHVYIPLSFGLAELAVELNLPSSQNVTNPAEEIAKGFLSAQAGVILGIALYRAVCKRKGKPVDSRDETGYAMLGAMVGLIGMTATGVFLHRLWGVTDVSWWPK